MPQLSNATQDVTVVIPCRDEAGALPGVLAAIPPGYRVIVVDNGSTDDTAAVASAAGASVIREGEPGYGAAVQTGIAATRTEVVAVLDGDGSMDPRELPALVGKLSTEVDLVVGRRRPVSRRDWPWHARLANLLIAWRLRRRCGLPIHDIAAMRVARATPLQSLGALHRRSGYPLALLLAASRARWRVVECDITYRPRSAGRSKVSGSLVGSARAARDFWTVLR